MMTTEHNETKAPTVNINELSSQFMKKEYGIQIFDGNSKISHQNSISGKIKYIKCHGKIFERLAEIRGAKRESDIIRSFIDRALIRLPIPGEDLIHMSLFNTIVILYGKVYTSNSRCRPHPDPHFIYNENEISTHNELMKIRNTVLAHAGDNKYEVNDIYLMVGENDDAIGYFFNFVDVAFSSGKTLTTIKTMVDKICEFYEEKAKDCLVSIYKKLTLSTNLDFLGEEKDEYKFDKFHSESFAYAVKFEAAKYEPSPFKILLKDPYPLCREEGQVIVERGDNQGDTESQPKG